MCRFLSFFCSSFLAILPGSPSAPPPRFLTLWKVKVTGGPKMAEIQYGAKPDIFKSAQCFGLLHKKNNKMKIKHRSLERWDPERWKPRRVGGPKFRAFFSLSLPPEISFLLLGNFKDVRFHPILNFCQFSRCHFWAALLKISGFYPTRFFRQFWADLHFFSCLKHFFGRRGGPKS